jgi:HK97 family phage portal protein
MVSLLLDGNAFIHVIRSGGDVVALTVLDPQRVEIRRNQAFRIEYAMRDAGVVFPKEDIVHIVEMRKPGSLRGVSRIEQLRETLGLTAALDDFASRFFGQGTVTSGIIEVPGSLTREQAKDLVDGFEMGHKGVMNAHRPGVLFGGAKWSKTGVDPDEAQMLESRRQQVEEVAKVFRVPLHMLSTAIQGAMSYASVEQNAIQFASYTIRPYVTKIENALTKLLPDGVFVRLNMDSILRGDLQSRFNAYSVGTQAGFLSINDIHRYEDMAPVEGGDVYRVPLANVNLSAASLTDQQLRVSMASDLIAAGFSPEEVLAAFGLPSIPHTGLPTTKVQSLADNPDVMYP